MGGRPPQSYGAFPPNNGMHPHGRTYGHTQPSYAAPGPTDAFPELISPLSPNLPSRPLRPPLPTAPTVVVTRKRNSEGNRGLIFWIIIVLLQVALIAYRSNTLAKSFDLKSKAFGASKERHALVTERKKSEREREKMRHDRGLWEKEKVPEDHVPQGARWEHIWPAYTCRAYGKQEHWGMLLDIPEGWGAMDACMNMPAEVKGVTVRRPHRCAFVDGFPHVHGYWMVDWDQEDCQPWHKDFRDVVSPSSLYLAGCCHTHACRRDARTIDPA